MSGSLLLPHTDSKGNGEVGKEVTPSPSSDPTTSKGFCLDDVQEPIHTTWTVTIPLFGTISIHGNTGHESIFLLSQHKAASFLLLWYQLPHMGSYTQGLKQSRNRPGSCCSNGNTCLPAAAWTWAKHPWLSTRLSLQIRFPSRKNITIIFPLTCMTTRDAGYWCHQEVHSLWASMVFLVWKKDRSLRFCIDLRKLNNWTIKDAYLLPHIDKTLNSLQGSQWFSSLDLKSGYWQVKMDEESKPLTSFTIQLFGFYECYRMPFRLTNAPVTFQWLMETCLGDLKLNWCIIYLDDIFIFSKDLASHLERLQAMF